MSLFLSSTGVKENRKILLCKKIGGGGGDGTDLAQKRSGFGAWQAQRKKEQGRVEAAGPDQFWQSDRSKIWAEPAVDRLIW